MMTWVWAWRGMYRCGYEREEDIWMGGVVVVVLFVGRVSRLEDGVCVAGWRG